MEHTHARSDDVFEPGDAALDRQAGRSADVYREGLADGRIAMEALTPDGVAQINREFFGPGTTRTILG